MLVVLFIIISFAATMTISVSVCLEEANYFASLYLFFFFKNNDYIRYIIAITKYT